MKKPLVSVIVLVHNTGKYLQPCLESIQAQTLQDLEVILVDNGSTPEDARLCEQWAAKDARFRVIHHENKGIIGGRGSGFSLAQGEYISFVDSDDLIRPDMLELLLCACRKTGLPGACCRFVPFLDAPPAPQPPKGEAQAICAPDHLEALLHRPGVDFSLCNKIYHRSLFVNIPFHSAIIYNEDLFLNWALLKNAPGMAFWDFVGYYYRQHSASASHRAPDDKVFEDQLQVAEMIRKDCRGGPLEVSAWAFYYEKVLYLDSMILRRKDASFYDRRHRELRVRLRTELRRALHCPRLAPAFKLTAILDCWLHPVYRLLCRTLLTDRR